MSDNVIQVQDLSKSYIIAHKTGSGKVPYKRFSDLFLDTAKATMSAFKKQKSGEEQEKFWALRDVSFEIKRGDVVGIIGRNGAGKSTLLKILSRITEPTSGRIEIEGRVASLLEVGTGFHRELTGRENIYLNGAILGMSRREIRKKFDEIVAFAEVEKFLDTPVRFYSSGMYVRLAFAVAAHLEPDILIVDEVLAVGDAQFQRKCLGKMQDVSTQEGRTVLFVSHNMGAVMNLCHRGVVMEKGHAVCDRPIQEAIDFYNQSGVHRDQSETNEPHILFEEKTDAKKISPAVCKIEMVDGSGQPLPILSTWDDVTFRIWYRSDRTIRRAAVELQFNVLNGSRILHLSTSPDGTLDMDIQPGVHFVECTINNIPLAAGEYTLTGALTLPQTEYIWIKNELASLTVHPKDVYGSGLAPNVNRALIAPIHSWTGPT